MSFGLKNAGATYPRAIQMCFADQLHRNVEAYVDDVVIKTRNSNDLIADLEEMFSSLRRFRWKLNPTKCIFEVPSGKLSDPGPRGCVHQGVRIGLGDRTCPVPYLCCILPACGVELVDTEGNYSSCS
jgi:hypothetical protein